MISKGLRIPTIGTAVGLSLILALPGAALAGGHGRLGAAASPRPLTPREHRFAGIVPSALAGGRRYGRPTKSEFAGTKFSAGNNLQYWGGNVMNTNTVYAIYWLGNGSYGSGFSATYESLINGLFSDVATAQNATDNVYAVDTQYSGPMGSGIANRSTFGGSVVDTNPIPDHCSAEYRGSGISVSGCVTDADIEAEVSSVAKAKGWTPGPNTMFFVFTPQNVGNCFDSTSGTCAYTYYCAYHSNYYDSSGNDVIYANLPYSEIASDPTSCDSGESPNGDPAADSTINLISHEHNEAITDPNSDAWYDSQGNEIGDKCAWDFGSNNWPSTGEAFYSQYNQTINGDHYYLQREWSNASSACALSYSPGAPAPPSVTGFSPNRAKTGTTVTVTGSGFVSGSTVSFNGGAAAATTYTSSTQLRAVVPSAASSGVITVINPGGSTAVSAASFLVQPTITSLSPNSGKSGTVVTINGSGLAGATSVAFKHAQATFTIVSANAITATVPTNAGSGPITVTTPAGNANSPNFNVTH